uniref:Uncharacterized protein n=1 Tax=Mesocestoides corti TaxID=53468 RepID=A0A5K3FUI2_MESCO
MRTLTCTPLYSHAPPRSPKLPLHVPNRSRFFVSLKHPVPGHRAQVHLRGFPLRDALGPDNHHGCRQIARLLHPRLPPCSLLAPSGLIVDPGLQFGLLGRLYLPPLALHGAPRKEGFSAKASATPVVSTRKR